MIVILDVHATEKDLERLNDRIRELGYTPHTIRGDDRLVVGITGNTGTEGRMYLEGLPGVLQVIRVSKPYKLASRETKPENSVIDVAGVKIGGGNIVICAGPCAVESRDQTVRIAKIVADKGAHLLRGGAYKPRTSPYAFQGLGEKGLEILAEAREITGLPVVTEVVDPGTVPLVGQYADMLQIGTRNMQNFSLLQEIGKLGMPVLMKRGMSATLEETLMSAEYLMSHGAHDVVVCERGVRTFGSHSRNTLDVSVIPAFKKLSHLPIIVDPSHAGGNRETVIPLALAGIGAGADGLMVDVHDDPDHALVDGPQALLPDGFQDLMDVVIKVSGALGKPIASPLSAATERA